MTQNQIEYWKNQYNYEIGSRNAASNEQANVLRAQELAHERSKLSETQRHNLQQERLKQLEDLAKYGRTKYNPAAFTEIGQSAEIFDTSKEVFDWIMDLLFGGLKSIGGKK